ncbi:MAG TPA: hypothetical protein ENJ37_03710 [Deltaproteobacteria bacterium]|nr:hypothetical protein [Deltaproteobacteria bacterium]
MRRDGTSATGALFVVAASLLLLAQGCGGDGGSAGTSTAAPEGAAAATGSVTLVWSAPATNTDGTPVADLAGYNIYYGASPGDYTAFRDAGNVTSYTLDGLNSGAKYFFAVTAYNEAGYESDYSNEVSASVP